MFGNRFNHTIVGVAWPDSLQQLSFGDRFNRRIVGVVWPASLRQPVFGNGFDRASCGRNRLSGCRLGSVSANQLTESCGRLLFEAWLAVMSVCFDTRAGRSFRRKGRNHYSSLIVS